MIIQRFENLPVIGKTITVKLPRPNLILDPRENWLRPCEFDCRYHADGITVTLTCIDRRRKPSGCPFTLRTYDPETETVPRFDTTTYTYMGVDGERAPYNTIVAIIDQSVHTIKKNAFQSCTNMRKCIMHDQVHTIEQTAFECCTSLEALFLPSSLRKIGQSAFYDCSSLRILPLPQDMDPRNIGCLTFFHCETFFRTTQIQSHPRYASIVDFYGNRIPPLHKACLQINVSTQTIHDCILTHGPIVASIIDHDGMTPLHILAMNPHADSGTIIACFEAEMSCAFLGDSRGNTPLEYLKEYNLEGYTTMITSLCIHRESSFHVVSERKRKRVN